MLSNMKLGEMLGQESRMDQAEKREQFRNEKAKRKARLQEISRAKSQGRMVIYKPGDR